MVAENSSDPKLTVIPGRDVLMWDGDIQLMGSVKMEPGADHDRAEGEHPVELRVMGPDGDYFLFRTTMRKLHQFVGLLQLGE